jgi:hypothetical protein
VAVDRKAGTFAGSFRLNSVQEEQAEDLAGVDPSVAAVAEGDRNVAAVAYSEAPRGVVEAEEE